MSLSVLITVTHLLGVGHLARAAAIARALAAAGHDVTLVSGGMPAPLVRTGRLRFVQLPPVRSAGTAFSTLLDEDGRPASSALLAERRRELTAIFARMRPDVMVTELFPFGRRMLADEFMALLAAAEACRPRPVTLASVRDVLVAPAKPERIAEAHRRLFRHYDGVLVHGDPAILPLEASWPLDATLAPLLRYTGYVGEPAPEDDEPAGDGRDEIVVSGGGSAAALPLYRAAAEAARLVREKRWRLLLGAGVVQADFAAVAARATDNLVVERARPDFPLLVGRSAVSVSQAGYNTVVDLFGTGVKAVLVPFEEGNETEQRLRADRLASHGLVTVLPQGELTAGNLARAVRAALALPPPEATAIDCGGLATTVRLVEEFARRRGGLAAPALAANSAESAWRRLDDALATAVASGDTLAFWWRDDDATAPTPALDRLLTLARRHAAPVALAAIPAAATRALAERLADEPLASPLVHGLSHRNHAPADEKKAEFGAHRPTAALVADAERALATARERFGARLLPIFVPPWNRIAPALVAELPALGFCGLSTFRDRPATEAAPGLIQVNTHLDPVDWHGSRSLVAEDMLLDGLVRAIAARRRADDTLEPIGLLTHHLVHDEAIWSFCERLIERLCRHAGVRIHAAREVFAAPSAGSGVDGPA
ncbi:glycosyltransferase [Chelatococcus sp. SYSU_G07232]|uniref:Glycosyltransferase n=1 Tax=Chelatococcus albus TaxID=3047466 RepID=A0ABT7AJA2_9HYPH|nr:glycosyltransferase [Chelatococcus sp. SYSU_G07232]MDJ1159455.1 glycosyltransferase [Chelatococcus sp. SYSU_G07232]